MAMRCARMGLMCAVLLAAPAVQAQTLGEMNAATSGMDTLNSGPVGPNPGAYLPAPGAVPGAPMPGLPGAQADPNAMPGLGNLPGVGAAAAAAAPVLPKVRVISGTRMFDAVTGELLDDATEQEVPETDRDKYFDDGTHGDIEAGDGKYTKVDESRSAIGQSNQRVKERLVQAVLASEQMNPLEFYGFSLMSTERHQTAARNRAWKVVPDPKGGPGFVLSEEPTNEPLQVPKYRTWQAEKDEKVKEDWAQRFLQEYRQNKDSLTSEFYPLYIPQPPPLPTVAPPSPQQWQPFADPGAADKAEQEALGTTGNMLDAGTPGVTGAPMGNASSRYF